MGLISVEAKFQYVPPVPVYPEINSVTFNAEADLREGEDNVESGSKVGSVSVDGGTPSYNYALEGGTDDDKFEIDSSNGNVTCKEDLTEGSYEIGIKVTDSQGKEGTTTGTVKVLAKKVEIIVAIPDEQADLLGKKVSDLQSKDTKITEGNVTGTLYRVVDYDKFSKTEKEGNYLALYFEQAKQSDTTIEIQVEGQEKGVKLDTDGLYVCRMTKEGKKPLNVKLSTTDGKEGELKLTVSDLVLTEDITTVWTVRDGELPTFNKQVKNLQNGVTLTDTTLGKGELSGTIKWVTNYTNPAGSEGNWVALHIDGTKLADKEIKIAIDGKEADPDKNDWNVNIRLDNKTSKTLQIKVDGKVIYELDCSKLEFANSSEKVLTVLSQDHQMGNKKVNELQTDVQVSKNGEITGTLNYITDLSLSTGPKDDGNYLCLHVDHEKLPKQGKITVGVDNMVDIDIKDYDVLLKMTDDRKSKKFKIAIDGETWYEYNLSGVNVQSKG